MSVRAAWAERADRATVADALTGGGALVPTGLIALWSGLLANIPSGWALCDGTQGTPDLRDRFIKSVAAAEQPGATGGAATHTHADHPVLAHSGVSVGDHAALVHAGSAVADHASHTHNYSQVINHTHPITDPGHSHITQRYPTATGGNSGFTIDTSMSGALADNTLPVKSNTTGISTDNPVGGVATGITTGPSVALTHGVTQPSDHAIQVHTVTQPSDHPAQSHQTVNHEPGFFKLAYIMKL